MAMTERRWVNTEPGVLALEGTGYRIVCSPHENGDFLLMRGERKVMRGHVLAMLKQAAAEKQSELEELGIG
jgi:hypothetical protein